MITPNTCDTSVLAIEHLSTLGYTNGDTVYYRAIKKLESGGTDSQKRSGVFPLIPSDLQKLNSTGYSIYVVVNGGGDSDAQVSQGKAIFYEHDNLEKEDQIYLWESLNLPNPTIQIDTGGKSIHSYWVFDTPVDIEKWKTLQVDLLKHSDGDQSIKNPSRVMRLAGFKHPSTGNISEIITNTSTKYSYETIRSILPKPEPQVRRNTQPSKVKPKTKSNNTNYIPPIPLERCLTKEHREALAIGFNEPGRDNMGCALARDLIGVANYVPSIQFDYRSAQYQLEVDGDPESLLWDYCRRCNPPLDQKDYDRILKSARDSNPSPSIRDDEMLKNCLRSWVKENSLQSTVKQKESKNKQADYGMEFESTPENGLFKLTYKFDDKKGEVLVTREYIGNHLIGIANVDSPSHDSAAIYINFQTYRNQSQFWTLPSGSIVFETSQMLSELYNRGYRFDIDKKKLFIEYLNKLGSNIQKTYTITDQTGWCGESYVTQNKTYSVDPNCDLKFRDVEPLPDAISEIKGTLGEWQKEIGSKCASNSRLIFALGTGLAAPLQPLTQIESGGFHMVGITTVGKTTMLKVAASVVGIKDIPTWRTTTNGLESIAGAHNHMLLPLDEILQADGKEVGSIAYMLANGQGKARMTKTLQNRKAKTWQLLFLSSGEIGMAAYMALAGIPIKGGQEVRLPDIPAVPTGSEFGIFELIHGSKSAKDFAESLNHATQKYHGTLLDAFLEKLVIDKKDEFFANKLKKRLGEIARNLAETTTDTAVARVSNRFALIQLALELAHSYNLLPFPAAHIQWAIKKMFSEWLNYRGGEGSIEIKNAVARIRHLLVVNEFSDRFYTLPKNENRGVVRNLLGYRKVDDLTGGTQEFWIPPSVFEKEFCDGVNKIELIKELQRCELLLPPRSDGKPRHQRKINGQADYYYVFGMIKVPEAAEAAEFNLQKLDSELDLAASDFSKMTGSGAEAGEAGQKEGGLPPLPMTGSGSEAGEEYINPYISTKNTHASPASPASGKKTLYIEKKFSPDLDDVVETDTKGVSTAVASYSPVSPQLKTGDRVISNGEEATVIANKMKKYQSPKKGEWTEPIYLIEFGSGERKWLVADVLQLVNAPGASVGDFGSEVLSPAVLSPAVGQSTP